MIPTRRAPAHPGRLLRVHYLEPLEMSQTKFAELIKISRVRLNELIKGKREITADTAIRLSRALGTSAEMWMNAQALYDLATADKVTGIRRIRRLHPKRDTSADASMS